MNHVSLRFSIIITWMQGMEKRLGELGQESDQELKKTLFPNAELNLLSPGSGCPLQAGTGHGRPGRAPGRC